MQCPAPAWVAQAVCGALERLHAAQTAPFTAIYQDHLRCLKTLRETQARMAVCPHRVRSLITWKFTLTVTVTWHSS
ncbi:hypothetical protein FOA52_011810 [Chlamydomonas sp. UWO 241]|nr:hypothetical protein FOA52_011810 [Chlamydomonas sp. UWO 241]